MEIAMSLLLEIQKRKLATKNIVVAKEKIKNLKAQGLTVEANYLRLRLNQLETINLSLILLEDLLQNCKKISSQKQIAFYLKKIDKLQKDLLILLD